MQVILELPDNLSSLPQHQKQTVIFEAYQRQAAKQSNHPTQREPSKWAKIVQRVEDDPVHLEGYSERLKKDMRERREN